jgi:hypothetical protein
VFRNFAERITHISDGTSQGIARQNRWNESSSHGGVFQHMKSLARAVDLPADFDAVRLERLAAATSRVGTLLTHMKNWLPSPLARGREPNQHR